MNHLARKSTKKSNAGINAGVEHVGGDMFVSVPKGDAIFMKVRVNVSVLEVEIFGKY